MDEPRHVSFEVVPKCDEGGKSIFDADAFPTLENLDEYQPPPGQERNRGRLTSPRQWYAAGARAIARELAGKPSHD